MLNAHFDYRSNAFSALTGATGYLDTYDSIHPDDKKTGGFSEADSRKKLENSDE